MLLTAAVAMLIMAMAAFRFYVLSGSGMVTGVRFGLVRVQGVILDPEPVNEFIERLRDDQNVLGVVLRIDSPGGVVGPSQEIHRAVKRLAETKPVVVSMGSVAASGGYYIACPAHTIIANPGTLTGSIGVKLEVANYAGLMEKIGMGYESVDSGKFKSTPSPYEELTDEEREYLQALVFDLHDQFVGDVAEGRNMTREEVRKVADGRVLSGRQAARLGLVDELGGLEDAFDELKSLCKVTEDLPVEEGPVEERSFLAELVGAESLIKPAKDFLAPRWQVFYQ